MNLKSFTFLYLILLFFVSCSDDPSSDDNDKKDQPVIDGIIYATPKSRASVEWDAAMILKDDVMLFSESEKSSTLLITNTKEQKNTTIVDFDSHGRITSMVASDFLIQGDYQGNDETGHFTLYTLDSEIDLGEIQVDDKLDIASRAHNDFVGFDAPIVNRAIKTYNFINLANGISTDAGKAIGEAAGVHIIDRFFLSKVTEPYGKFILETDIAIIISLVTGSELTIPVGIAIAMFNTNAIIDELRARRFVEVAGLLSAVTLCPQQISDDVYDLGVLMGSVNTIPEQYKGKTVVGLLYKEVDIDSDDTDTDIFDPEAEIILQAVPVEDCQSVVRKKVGHNKKIILRAFIIPATEVPRLQNGLITRSGTSLIKYPDTFVFINSPVSVVCRQLDFKGTILTEDSKVIKKTADISLEFLATNDAYTAESSTPIIDWGVVLYCDGKEQMRFSMVTGKDNPWDNSDPANVTSTQNITIDASLLDIDYDSFRVTADRWTFGSYVEYYRPFMANSVVFGSQQYLELQYTDMPSDRWFNYSVANVRPFKVIDGVELLNYSAEAQTESSGMLFVDEVYSMLYAPALDLTIRYTTNDELFSDGIRRHWSHEYKDWNYSTNLEVYDLCLEMVSKGRKFYSDNCVHLYCGETIDSFEGSLSPFPGDVNNAISPRSNLLRQDKAAALEPQQRGFAACAAEWTGHEQRQRHHHQIGKGQAGK